MDMSWSSKPPTMAFIPSPGTHALKAAHRVSIYKILIISLVIAMPTSVLFAGFITKYTDISSGCLPTMEAEPSYSEAAALVATLSPDALETLRRQLYPQQASGLNADAPKSTHHHDIYDEDDDDYLKAGSAAQQPKVVKEKRREVEEETVAAPTEATTEAVPAPAVIDFGPSEQPSQPATEPFLSLSGMPFDYLEPSATANYDHAMTKSQDPALDSKPFKRVSILGERNSGTNLVVTMFQKNIEGLDVSPGVTQIKHYFQPWPESQSELDDRAGSTLVVLVTRNPYDWLNSMYNTCYCCEVLSRHFYTFDQFLDKTFETSLENPFNHEKRPTPACPIDRNLYRQDRNEGIFENVLAARYEKLDHFLNVSRWAPAFEVVRWEDLLSVDQQQQWFSNVVNKWNLPHSSNFAALDKDARTWKEEEAPGAFSHQDRLAKSVYLNSTLAKVDETLKTRCELANQHLNAKLEGLMGYSLLDC